MLFGCAIKSLHESDSSTARNNNSGESIELMEEVQLKELGDTELEGLVRG